MAAQRVHIAAHGAPYAAHEAPYSWSGAAFGCRGVAFGCTGTVYSSHAADMQYMLHLAGPGWGPGREGTRPGDGKVMILGP